MRNKSKIWRIIFPGMALLLAFSLGIAPIASTSGVAEAAISKVDLVVTKVQVQEVQ